MALFKKKCEYCKKVEKMLYEMRVKYKVIDVTKNPELITKYQKIDPPPRLKSRGLKRCSIFGCSKCRPHSKECGFRETLRHKIRKSQISSDPGVHVYTHYLVRFV